MEFKDALEYLRFEHSRLLFKTKDLNTINLDIIIESCKDMYADNQQNLYEKDIVLFKELKKMFENTQVPHEEQDINTYLILNRHSLNVIGIFNDNKRFISKDILLATLPTNDFNAFVSMFPNNKMLIVLNHGLIFFIYLMGRAVASFFSIIDKDKDEMTFDLNEKSIRENIETNKEGHYRFIEALVLFFINRDLLSSNIYYQEDEKLNMSGNLWDNAELFVVAHEYSHVLLDHLSLNNDFQKEYLDEESLLYKVKRNWEAELSADDLALQTVLAYNQKANRGLLAGYMGIEFLFVCIDIIEKASHIEGSDTHPTSKIRIKNIRNSLRRILPEQYKMIIDECKIIEEIGNKLWDINKNTIDKLLN